MVNRTLSDLVKDLKQRREVGDPPPVVLLGAGASVESGIGAMTDLFQFVDVPDFDRFTDYITPLTAPERYRLLARFLQTRQPADVTPGYRALAALCAEAYLDFILTTNLDPLLDDALSAAHLWRKDYMLLVNGLVRPERFDLLLTAPSPRVKVLKLHGDLFDRFMAWTPAEMEQFLQEVTPPLNPALRGRDMLVVGHSLRDERIRDLVLKAEGVVWYTHPVAVPDMLAQNPRVRAVVGPDSTFERLFTGLARGLGVPVPVEPVVFGKIEKAHRYADEGTKTYRGLPPPEPVQQKPIAGGRVQTVDDFMAAVVGVLAANGQPGMTGFLLAEPRVIVTDGYAANVSNLPDPVVILTSDGRRLKTRVRKHVQTYPFGPLILDVPPAFKANGLALSAETVAADQMLSIGVAAGERIGISSGAVKGAGEMSIDIAPVGKVEHLVAINAVVAPGASGAPVVDGSFAVRGFVVAGATDAPPSLMYPASRWAHELDAKKDSPASRRSRGLR